MDINKIYYWINTVLDSYLNDGIKPEHLLKFLNTTEDNYKFMYNRIYRKLTMEDIPFETNILEECLKDSIRDKIALINDISKKV